MIFNLFLILCSSLTLFNELKTLQHSEIVPEIAATCLLLTLHIFALCCALVLAPYIYFLLPREGNLTIKIIQNCPV